MKTAIWTFTLGICVEFVISVYRPVEDMERSIAPNTLKTLTSLPGSEDCGISGGKTGRIVGGEPAKLGAWPWIAAVGQQRRRDVVWFFCGGSLISDRHVITAAHCVQPHRTDTGEPGTKPTYKELLVRVGDLDLDDSVDDGASPQTIPVGKIAQHPLFKNIEDGYDIAILTLAKRVTFSDLIRPICLPVKDVFYQRKDFEGYQPFVAGWGMTKYMGKKSNMLLQVQLPLLSVEDCTEMLQAGGTAIHADSFCAYIEGKDSCGGDSGGPLMLPIQDRYYLYGLVSYGHKCAQKDSPGVYNKVHTHLQWIANQLD